MKRALPFVAPLALTPLLGAGLWLWRDQGAFVWLSDFAAACF
jgi:hypothetical protein